MMRKSELRCRIAQVEKDAQAMEKPDYNSAITRRAQKRMLRVDALPSDVRAVVYEYGLEIVQEFLNHGVKRASSIKHLIDTSRCADNHNNTHRFQFNKGPNSKRNPINLAAEDEYYSAPKSSDEDSV